MPFLAHKQHNLCNVFQEKENNIFHIVNVVLFLYTTKEFFAVLILRSGPKHYLE